MTTQKYYIAACWNPLDTRVPTLLIDADNENGTYYRCSDVDPELARLRELCAEHETCVADHNLKDIELASLRERVGELEKANQILRSAQENMACVIASHVSDKVDLAKRCEQLMEALRLARKYAHCDRECSGSSYENGQRVSCGCGFAEALPKIIAAATDTVFTVDERGRRVYTERAAKP